MHDKIKINLLKGYQLLNPPILSNYLKGAGTITPNFMSVVLAISRSKATPKEQRRNRNKHHPIQEVSFLLLPP